MSRHIATDYTDTTPGAIHKYYDENGEIVFALSHLVCNGGLETDNDN